MHSYVYSDCAILRFDTFGHFNIARRFLVEWCSYIGLMGLRGFFDFGRFSLIDYSILRYIQTCISCPEFVPRVSGKVCPSVSVLGSSDVLVFIPLDAYYSLRSVSGFHWMQNEVYPSAFPDGYTFSAYGCVVPSDLKYLRYLRFLNSLYKYDRKK